MKISTIIAQTYAVEQQDVHQAFNLACEHIETRANLNELFRQYDKADTSVVALETIAILLKDYHPRDSFAMEVITTSVVSNLEACGVYIKEHIKYRTPEQRFAIATEGLGEWISRIWMAVAKFMSKTWDFIKSFFTSSSKSEASVERIEKVTKVVDSFKRDEAEITAAVKDTKDNSEARKKLKEIIAEREGARETKLRSTRAADADTSLNKSTSSKTYVEQFNEIVSDMKIKWTHSDDAGIQGLGIGDERPSSAKDVIKTIDRAKRVIEELLRLTRWTHRNTASGMYEYSDSSDLKNFFQSVSPKTSDLERQLDCKMKSGVFNPRLVSGLDFSFAIDPTAEALASRIESNHPTSFKPTFYLNSRKGSVSLPLLKDKSEFDAVVTQANEFRKLAQSCKESIEFAQPLVKRAEQFAQDKAKQADTDMKSAAVAKLMTEAMVFYCVNIPTKMFTAIEHFNSQLERYVEISAHNADPLVAAKHI